MSMRKRMRASTLAGRPCMHRPTQRIYGVMGWGGGKQAERIAHALAFLPRLP